MNCEIEEVSALQFTEKWLLLIDNQNVVESWEDTTSIFQRCFSLEKWRNSLESYKCCRKSVSRSLRKIQSIKRTVGMPESNYVEIEFETVFVISEEKFDYIEKIVQLKESDDQYKVFSYHSRPWYH